MSAAKLAVAEAAPDAAPPFGVAFDALVDQRRAESDAFYATVAPAASHWMRDCSSAVNPNT